MANRAWCALGAAGVLVIAAGAADGCAPARGGEALAAAGVGDTADDASGVDSAEEPALTPDVEAPDVQSAPDALGDDTGAGGDDATGGSSSGSVGGPADDSGPPVVVVDSGNGAPPGGMVDASVESGGVADAGVEAAGLADAGSLSDSGARRSRSGGIRVAQDPSAGDPVGAALGGAPSYAGDDASSADDAGATFGGSWDGDGAAPPALEMSPSRAVLGCAGCSVPDASASGGLAWLLVALTAAVRALRRRTR